MELSNTLSKFEISIIKSVKVSFNSISKEKNEHEFLRSQISNKKIQ